ncbi:MAG: hypothetical protein A2X94_02680 [Bdellovibrionales bacterium GWB1_55_8]|nr:MAG: hypothetical protein A2X94_02680 [Bdellovibrionales bacterium GWB1_55_8]
MVKNIWQRVWPLLVFVAPWLLVGALIGSVPGYKFYEYVWKDDRFCTSCHVHDYASIGWKDSIHGQLTTCHDCHHQPLVDYARESIVLITKQPKFPKDLHHTPYVPKDLCEACHVAEADRSTLTGPLVDLDVGKLPKVDGLFLHNVHLRKQTRVPLPSTVKHGEEEKFGIFEGAEITKLSEPRELQCADCHGGPANRAHDFSVADRSCVRCHATSHRTKLVQEFGCRNCHYQDFLTPLSELTPKKK